MAHLKLVSSRSELYQDKDETDNFILVLALLYGVFSKLRLFFFGVDI